MRTIKFRAWNGDKMIYYNHWFTLDRQQTLCFEEQIEHHYVDDSDVDYPSRVILMQFTGWKDKNGKEIFEDDICKMYIFAGVGWVEQKGIVKWQEVEGRFSIEFESDFTFPPDNFDKDWNPSGKSSEPEIIGNKWENPELAVT